MSRRLDSLCVLLLVWAAGATACNNKGAYLSGPAGTLAVGAYGGLGYGDACSNSGSAGKLPVPNFCTAEHVTEVLDLSASDPSVVDIIAGKDHPRGSAAQSDGYYVVGKNPGQTIIRFKGRFDDGSVREASTTVHVGRPDSFRLMDVCDDPDPVANLLVPVGTQEGFWLEIYAGTEQLVGWLPDAVTADGVTQGFDDRGDNPYLWQAPATPVVLQLQSALVSTVTGTLTAFGLDQVDSIALDSYDDRFRHAFTVPDEFVVNTTALVGGHVPCRRLPVWLHSSTPAVCSGPEGQTILGGDNWSSYVTAHAEGVCTLAASLPDQPVLTTTDLPIFFVSEPPSGQAIPGFGDPCTVEGATACPYGYGEVGLCKSGHWVEQPFCPADQVCDFVPDTTSGCVAGTVCARCRGLR